MIEVVGSQFAEVLAVAGNGNQQRTRKLLAEQVRELTAIHFRQPEIYQDNVGLEGTQQPAPPVH